MRVLTSVQVTAYISRLHHIVVDSSCGIVNGFQIQLFNI